MSQTQSNTPHSTDRPPDGLLSLPPLPLPSADAPKLTWALWYAQEVGWPVFPLFEIYGGHCSCSKAGCKDAGKHPRTPHGFKDATTEEDRIRVWWSRWPHANIGTPTGATSGTLVLDCDDEDAGAFVLEHSSPTLSQRTGSGGRQFFFVHEEGFKNWQKVLGNMDVRTTGGYVVLPPSSNRNGLYRWEDVLPIQVLPEKLRETLVAFRNREKRLVASATSKVVKVLQNDPPSLASIEKILCEVKDGFAEEERIPEGSRHHRLLEMGGSLRGKGIPQKKIISCLAWVNANLCNPSLEVREFENIVLSVMKIKAEVNELVNEFEEWVETLVWSGKAAYTDKKVLKTLLMMARKFGKKGVEGLEVAVSQLDLKDAVGVGYKTVRASLARMPYVESYRNPDYSKCSTIVILYPNGIEVDENGEVVVSPFVRQGVNSNKNIGNRYKDWSPRVHSRWGPGRLGLTKEDFLNRLIENIGLGKPFRLSDLSFIDGSYDFKRRHLCDLANPKKWGLKGRALVERVRQGLYMLPEDLPGLYEVYRSGSGEQQAEKRELEKTKKRRDSYRYTLATRKTIEEGETSNEALPLTARQREFVERLSKGKITF